MPLKKRKRKGKVESAVKQSTTFTDRAALCSKTRALMAHMPAHEIAERTGISVATLYRWRAAVPSRVSSAAYNALIALHKYWLAAETVVKEQNRRLKGKI